MTRKTDALPVKCLKCGGQCLGKMDFLKGLPPDRQQMVMDNASVKNFAKGSMPFMEGDSVTGIFVILHGRAKLSTCRNDGREQIAEILYPGDTVWEGVFMEGSRHTCSCVCLDDTVCCVIDRKCVEKSISDPVISMNLVGFLSKSLMEARQRNILLSTANPKSRLAGFLLYRSAKNGEDTVRLRLDDIAASIGMRPETVSRKLKELERDLLVEKVGQSSIHILNHQGLRQIFETN